MKNKKNIISIAVIFLVVIIILSELFLNDRFQGHDTVFHVANIIKLSETISLKNLFGSNLITYNMNKFGYGIWLFYPKIPHLFGAYIYLIVKDIYLSMKIVYFITTLLSGIFTYFLSKKIFNNKNIALLSSVIYITVPYHICEIYVRDAFAENFIFFVLPMIFLGLYNLKENNYFKFYILFILGYVIGMNSHLVSMFFYTIFIGIFILCYYKCFFKKDKIKALFISTVIVTCLTLPYLVSILEHKALGVYRVFTSTFTDLYTVIGASINFNALFIQEPMINDIMPYFSVVTIVLFVLSTISLIFNKEDEYRTDKKILLTMMLIVISFICSKVIWKYVPSLFLSIQFPWRLLLFLSLLVSLYSPCILIKFKFSNRVKCILPIVIIVLIVFEGINNIMYNSEEEVLVDVAINSKHSMGYQYEYLPEPKYTEKMHFGVSYFLLKDYEIITDNSGIVEITKDDFPNMEFVVEDLDDVMVIELPRTYYLGYELVDENNNIVEIYNNDNGFIATTIKKNGTYKLSYVKTKLYRLAELIRFVTVLVVGGVLAVKFIKWKKRRLQF